MMKIIRWTLLTLALPLCLATGWFVTGCHKTLEPGGAYAATNTVADLPFYQIDSGFRAAYGTLDAAFKWERDNRLDLWKISPSIKHDLDAIRPTAAEVVQNYAVARTAYKANPTPAGLSQLSTILAKAQQLMQTAQAVINNNLVKKP